MLDKKRNFLPFFLLLFSTFLFAQSSFITQTEYASMLYKNPRGIGCDKCHGLYGEGKLIAKYAITKKVKKGDEVYTIKIPKEFRTPAINNLTYKEFKESFEKSLNGMPRYYLTQKEIKALYFYLQQINLEQKNGK